MEVEENVGGSTVKIGNKIISGFLDAENKRHEDCGAIRVYYEDYDAYFCPKCNVWLESKCSDPKCEYCTKRPEKPL